MRAASTVTLAGYASLTVDCRGWWLAAGDWQLAARVHAASTLRSICVWQLLAACYRLCRFCCTIRMHCTWLVGQQDSSAHVCAANMRADTCSCTTNGLQHHTAQLIGLNWQPIAQSRVAWQHPECHGHLGMRLVAHCWAWHDLLQLLHHGGFYRVSLAIRPCNATA
jgi:hypothetical protein